MMLYMYVITMVIYYLLPIKVGFDPSKKEDAEVCVLASNMAMNAVSKIHLPSQSWNYSFYCFNN